MRVIAGTARSLNLKTPAGLDTRPTTDRIKETLFNMLQADIPGCVFVDMFSGSGGIGIEALSRGAGYAVIVDCAREAIQAIERNAQAVLKDDLDKRARIIRADYRSAIGSLGGMSFDLVFLDPPYRMVEAYGDALKRLRAQGALAEGCIIIAERLREREIPLPEGFESYDTRSYGATSVEFLREVAR